MSTLSFLTPVALALSALTIPIILLYMLRLRRTETPISSTFLWRQLVRDQEANAPWQRLHFSWLLLLQLLVLLALVLALARPFSKIKTITTGRIVLLLDASASMKATDVGPNRFAAARDIGLDMVDTLGADDTMTVIRVSDVPEVLAAASRDKLVLRDAIRSAEATDASADWNAAMTLAAAGAVGVDELKVVIVSDGGLPPNLPSVPGDVRYVPVGKQNDNVAISALAIGSLPGSPPQLFARLQNYGDQDADVIMDIELDGSMYWAYRYTVPAQNYVNIYEVELPETFDTLTAHLSRPSDSTVPDYLPVDDVAYAVRNQTGAGRVLLVTEDNIFLRQIFRSLRGVELYEARPEDGLPQQQDFDLYVFDNWLPDTLPDGDLLLVNPPSSTSFLQVGDEQAASGTISVHRDDPRTRNLGPYMESVHMGRYHLLSGFAEWGTVLVQVDGNPLVVVGEEDNRQIAVLAFNASYPATDMVLQPAWPILMAELADWFSPPRVVETNDSLPPGSPVALQLIEDADGVVVTRPDGEKITPEVDGSEATFADTLRPGLYRVDLRKNGRTIKTERFAVNLFDPAESRITPASNLQIGTSTVSRDAKEETGRREYWPWVAALGLLIVLVEWLVYHRSLRRLPRITLAGLRGSEGSRRSFWKRPASRRSIRLTRTRS